MRTVSEIDSEIQALEEKLQHIEGRPTEVYSRIVGYYRSLKNWNLGKREEYSHRVVFDVPDAVDSADEMAATVAGQSTTAGSGMKDAFSSPSNGSRPVEYIYFFRQTCPSCPPVRNVLSHIPLPGVEMDADSEEGTRLALEYGIYATPTIVFFDSKRDEVYRVSSVGQLNELKIPQLA